MLRSRPSVRQVRAETFESFDLETSFLVNMSCLQNVQTKFAYQSHWVKVKVTGAKQRVCVSRLWIDYLQLKHDLLSL